MPSVVGCRFRGSYKVYYFAPGNTHDLVVNDQVIVETSRGRELAQVVNPSIEIDGSQIVGDLKPVVRRATPADLLEAEKYRRMESEVIEQCKEQITKANLPMKIVDAEYNYDGSCLTFYFTSEQRVDFRDLVRELARVFRTRIELRQVGVRDEAKVIGGVGKCGRPLCCASWLPEFYPVSIRMAKMQDLPLSPMEISGCCGRLLCCLSYENDLYAEVKSRFPKVGKTVQIACGPVKVIKVDALTETATVLLEDGTLKKFTAEQLAGDAPLECPVEDEDDSDEPGDALDGVLATLGDRARQSLESSHVDKPSRTSEAGTNQLAAAERREVRPSSPASQRRTPSPAASKPSPRMEQAAPQRPQASETPAGAAAEKRRRRRGGRHHSRHGIPRQNENPGRDSNTQE